MPERDDEPKLVIAGKGESIDSIKRRAQKLKNDDDIRRKESLRNPDRVTKILEQQLSEQTRARKSQEQFYALSQRDYSHLVSAFDAQVPINPAKWEIESPFWFNRINEGKSEVDAQKEKNVIRTMLAINYAAARKRASGSLDAALKPGEVEGVEIEIDRDALDLMWNEMPGFRITVATVMNDLFEVSSPNPEVQSKYRERERHAVFSDKGKLILGGIKFDANRHPPEWEDLEGIGIDKYKANLITRLTGYLKDNPQDFNSGRSFSQVTPEIAARAAVSTWWNTLYMGSVPESADEGANLIPIPIVMQASVRSYFHPADTVRVKFKVGDKAKEGDVEESWGGSLGDFYRDRISYDATFKAAVENGTVNMFPDRMMYSLLDVWKYGQGTYEDESFSNAVLSAPTISRGNGLIDFDNPSTLSPTKLSDDKLWWRYSSRGDTARQVYELLAGKADPNKFDAGDFATSIAALNNNEPWMGNIYYNTDMLTAAVGILAMFESKKVGAPAESFYPGTNYLIPQIPDQYYDPAINKVLTILQPQALKNDPNLRRTIMDNLLAKDLYSTRGALIAPLAGSIVAKRGREIRAARINVAQRNR